MKITGTLIKNFFHCKRQAYLFYYGLNFKNELVKIGEIMHEERNCKEMLFEKIKIDDIKEDTLIEYKKTSSNLKGTKYQLLYYLNYFRTKGLNLLGKIVDLTYNKEYEIILDLKEKEKLDKVLKDIRTTLEGEMPPRMKFKKNCKGCSFFDYCWLE